MIKEDIFIILEFFSFLFIIWCVYHYDWFFDRWNKLKERKARWKFDMGDRYIEEINKLTGHKGG
jgi:hypothetical protein